jgi:hypothetical protein
MEYFKEMCMICHEIKEVRHINLYPIGSEGLLCCRSCEDELLEYIREMMRESVRTQKDEKVRKRRKFKRN